MRIQLRNNGVRMPLMVAGYIMSPTICIRPVTTNVNRFRKNLNNTETKWPPLPQGTEAVPAGGSFISSWAIQSNMNPVCSGGAL